MEDQRRQSVSTCFIFIAVPIFAKTWLALRWWTDYQDRVLLALKIEDFWLLSPAWFCQNVCFNGCITQWKTGAWRKNCLNPSVGEYCSYFIFPLVKALFVCPSRVYCLGVQIINIVFVTVFSLTLYCKWVLYCWSKLFFPAPLIRVSKTHYFKQGGVKNGVF